MRCPSSCFGDQAVGLGLCPAASAPIVDSRLGNDANKRLSCITPLGSESVCSCSDLIVIFASINPVLFGSSFITLTANQPKLRRTGGLHNTGTNSDYSRCS